MPWQSSSRRTVKSTLTSRVASSCGRGSAAARSLITWRQFGREGGSRVLQGAANMMVQQPNIVLSLALTDGKLTLFVGPAQLATRLEGRPLGVWVGEGLKEEIAGERGPWRASHARLTRRSFRVLFA
eukprot:scaffold86732_cov78-Phaeocystis_antarctica.AAC.2